MCAKKDLRLYKDKLGQRQYTFNALREKIEEQFAAETSGRADILQELDTREKRLAAVTEAADYVLATEYVNLPANEKRRVIEEAVANLFYFGPLDRYLRDMEITEMSVEGPSQVAVRRGFAEMETVDSPFDNLPHLEETLTRIIAPAGAVLSQDNPFLEVGLTIHERPVRVSLITPPISPMYSVQLRLHPVEPISLADLIPDVLPQMAADLLDEILQAGRGFIVTGEQGTGKTTLINALLNAQEGMAHTVIVERAPEINTPASRGYQRLPVAPQADYDAQIIEAISHHTPHTLVLDEIRGEESQGLWAALSAPDLSQLIMAFRGTSDPARLHSAITMTIHKKQYELEAASINEAVISKLPFVVVLHRYKSEPRPRLSLLGQWVNYGESLGIEPLVTWAPNGVPERTAALLRI